MISLLQYELLRKAFPDHSVENSTPCPDVVVHAYNPRSQHSEDRGRKIVSSRPAWVTELRSLSLKQKGKTKMKKAHPSISTSLFHVI
jgi:hypothetical protein